MNFFTGKANAQNDTFICEINLEEFSPSLPASVSFKPSEDGYYDTSTGILQVNIIDFVFISYHTQTFQGIAGVTATLTCPESHSYFINSEGHNEMTLFCNETKSLWRDTKGKRFVSYLKGCSEGMNLMKHFNCHSFMHGNGQNSS